MATQPVCGFNKFGYCKFRNNCRKLHVNECCESETCEIKECELRHPKPCRYYRDFRRCKFSNCKFKHVDYENDVIKKIESDNKDILAKIAAIDETIKLLDHQEKMLEMETRLNDEVTEKDYIIKELENRVGNMELKINNLFEKISVLEKEKEKTKKVEKSITCSFCDFSTTSESGLKIHVKKKHTSVDKETYPRSCHLCDETFDDSKEMKKHLLTHSYKKAKYLCDECDFVGKSKVTMAVHIGKNHSEKFDCGLCDLETNSLQNLETHLKTCEAYECDYYTG